MVELLWPLHVPKPIIKLQWSQKNSVITICWKCFLPFVEKDVKIWPALSYFHYQLRSITLYSSFSILAAQCCSCARPNVCFAEHLLRRFTAVWLSLAGITHEETIADGSIGDGSMAWCPKLGPSHSLGKDPSTTGSLLSFHSDGQRWNCHGHCIL
jgi:hypothetical protein